MAGDWMLMLHYAAAAGYDDQWSDRGTRRVVSMNWVMGMASHPLLGGQVTFRAMLSAEPATAGGSKAIPLLLQTGETYGGESLHDRQHPHDLHRLTASITYVVPWLSTGTLAATLWCRNISAHGNSDSFLLEANVDIDGRNVPFGRLEYVQKLGHELVVPGDPDTKYDVARAALGHAHRFGQLGPAVPVIGASVDVGLIPGSLESVYGTRVPVGAFVFLGLQPPRKASGHPHGG
jgi:hypothetical protein